VPRRNDLRGVRAQERVCVHFVGAVPRCLEASVWVQIDAHMNWGINFGSQSVECRAIL
jgi:hypothetical protein